MRQGPPRAKQRAGSLHLVDPENLAGDAFAPRSDTLVALDRYSRVAGYAEGDLAYVAGNRWLLEEAVFELPFTARVRWASGIDGADLALLAEAPAEWVCRRFGRLVIGSGDHIFSGLAETALDAGVPVTVVGRAGSIARIYSDLGCEVFTLDGRRTPPTPVANAAVAA